MSAEFSALQFEVVRHAVHHELPLIVAPLLKASLLRLRNPKREDFLQNLESFLDWSRYCLEAEMGFSLNLALGLFAHDEAASRVLKFDGNGYADGG